MERVGEHFVPAGPLAPRWLAWELDDPRAGVTSIATIVAENAGSATWRSRGGEGVQIAYHWLDPLGNPIVWDGVRTALPRPVAPGETLEMQLPVVAPRPPGRYRLAFDLVEEFRFWFAEIGCSVLDAGVVDVAPRIVERRLRAVVHGQVSDATAAALAQQEEPVVETDAVATAHLAGVALPAPDWSTRLLDAHAEGFPAVGGAVEPAGRVRHLKAWAPGGGRNPRFEPPLLFPSLLDGLEPDEYHGLPAYSGDDTLFDGRIVVRLPRQSGRRQP